MAKSLSGYGNHERLWFPLAKSNILSDFTHTGLSIGATLNMPTNPRNFLSFKLISHFRFGTFKVATSGKLALSVTQRRFTLVRLAGKVPDGPHIETFLKH